MLSQAHPPSVFFQANLDSERNRSADLTKTNAELLRCKPLQGHWRCYNIYIYNLIQYIYNLIYIYIT